MKVLFQNIIIIYFYNLKYFLEIYYLTIEKSLETLQIILIVDFNILSYNTHKRLCELN